MTLTAAGPAALVVALAGAGAGVALSLLGRARIAGRFLALAFAGLSVAVVALGVALATNDGSLLYVADNTSRATSWPYRLSGLWAGMAGSLLMWTWTAAGWAVVTGRAVRRRAPELAGLTQAVLGSEVALLAGLLVAVSRPFARLAVPALDGGGLNPVLLHPAMLYHPPLLFAGAVGLAVPFALAVAGLISGTGDGRWLPLAVRSCRVSLLLLSAGLLAGAHWAYVELGWGGYWAWDPVENGGLLPWLGAVAFLHAAVVARREPASSRGSRPVTTAAALAGLAFLLGLLGSFVTRSGATLSVHAFAAARAVGWVLVAGLGTTAAAGAALVVRARRRYPLPAALPALSRRGAIVANNLLLVGLVVAIGFGTVFPVLARALNGNRVVVTGRYFSLVATPLAVVLLALIGVGPRLGWEATPGTTLRRRLAPAAWGLLSAASAGVWLPEPRPVAILMIGLAGSAAALTVAGWRRGLGAGSRRPRWQLAHLGVAVLLAGVAGTTTGARAAATLAPGQELALRGWTLRLEAVRAVPAADGGRAAEARILLSRNGRPVATLRPVAVRSLTGQRVAVAALRSTPLGDVQVALRAVGEGGRVAVVEIGVLPLVQLVWWGGLLVVAGMALGLRQMPTERQAGTRAAPELVAVA